MTKAKPTDAGKTTGHEPLETLSRTNFMDLGRVSFDGPTSGTQTALPSEAEIAAMLEQENAGVDFERAMKLMDDEADALAENSELLKAMEHTRLTLGRNLSVPVDKPTDGADLPNPYLLESGTVLNDLAYEAQRATRIIDGLAYEMDQIAADADLQIKRIEARRDTELAQRRKRTADLQKIIDAHAAVAAIQPVEEKSE